MALDRIKGTSPTMFDDRDRNPKRVSSPSNVTPLDDAIGAWKLNLSKSETLKALNPDSPNTGNPKHEAAEPETASCTSESQKSPMKPEATRNSLNLKACFPSAAPGRLLQCCRGEQQRLAAGVARPDTAFSNLPVKKVSEN